MYVSITAAGISRRKIKSRRLKHWIKIYPSWFLVFGLKSATMAAAPRLKATASPNIKAGSSKMP